MSTEPPEPATSVSRPPRRRRLPVLVEILLAVLVVALVQAFVAKPFGVPSQSMEHTLEIGDRIIVNRLDRSVSRGDIVVFSHGETWQDTKLPRPDNPINAAVRDVGDLTGFGPSNTAYTVKRVIGMAGDTVRCCDPDGKVIVNDSPIDEPYVFDDHPYSWPDRTCSSTPRSSRCFPRLVVPPGRVLVLGDHRSQSADSVVNCRGGPEANGCAKFVPVDRVLGQVVYRIWPLTTMGKVSG